MINQIKCLCNVRHSTRICLSIDYIYDILKTREAMRNWKIKSQFKWNIVQFTIYNLVSSGKNWNRLRHDARKMNHDEKTVKIRKRKRGILFTKFAPKKEKKILMDEQSECVVRVVLISFECRSCCCCCGCGWWLIATAIYHSID